jgi:hypothetical protein
MLRKKASHFLIDDLISDHQADVYRTTNSRGMLSAKNHVSSENTLTRLVSKPAHDTWMMENGPRKKDPTCFCLSCHAVRLVGFMPIVQHGVPAFSISQASPNTPEMNEDSLGISSLVEVFKIVIHSIFFFLRFKQKFKKR